MTADRAIRVLDAAGELLLAYGYRKVTVADVAERAGVGKGTVYLHWPSKTELFGAVLVREGVTLGYRHVADLQADPANVQLHRALRSSYLTVMRRPLARALYCGDAQLLGTLITDTKIGLHAAASQATHRPRHLALLHRHGLLADDPADDPTVAYRLGAATLGFYLLGELTGGGALDLEVRADALASVVRRSFEPAEPPPPDALARAAVDVRAHYEEVLVRLAAPLPAGAVTDHLISTEES